jgi:glycosyltransferase involved in cell wall biosynthesis
MKVLIVLTYYQPHVSGLTIYAVRLARALVARGHEVTVLTSQFERRLPLEEFVDGVRVVRVPVAFRVSKGVIMPGFGSAATRLVREHDVVSLHLPQFDAWGLALRGRLLRRPVVLTYHCDLQLPPSPFNRVVNTVVDAANDLAGRWSDAVVAYTDDFARHSPYLQRFRGKLHVIAPPVELPAVTPDEIAAFRRRFQLDGGPLIGMVARLATEKGVEVLLEALPAVLERHPGARGVFAGQYQNVMGEEAYAARIQQLIDRVGPHWQFTGLLNPREVAAFMHTLSCLTVPSLNSTESFGLVQIEAMLCGTPVVASNLPGVRQPVQLTGMGEIAPVGDPAALAERLLRVIGERDRYLRPPGEIAARFSPAAAAAAYEQLFTRLVAQAAPQRAGAPS